MIHEQCFTKEWIDGKRKDLQVMDPGLLEKCIYALQLLGRLSENGEFDFVFKGGSSLILLLANLRRLSIDIDIVSAATPAEYEPVLESIGRTPPFIRFEQDHPVASHHNLKDCHASMDGILIPLMENRPQQR